MVDSGTAGDDLEKMNEEAIQFEETLNSIAEKLGKTTIFHYYHVAVL